MSRALAAVAVAVVAALACEPRGEPERACAEPTGAPALALERICACVYAESGYATPDECFGSACICQGVEACDVAIDCIAALDDDGKLCDGIDACVQAGCRELCEAAYRRVYECCGQSAPEDVADDAADCCGDAACADTCDDTAAADCSTILANGCPPP
ncbi:MAG: hypothetical protein AABZ30_08005 [Myxococcota bacterium]